MGGYQGHRAEEMGGTCSPQPHLLTPGRYVDMHAGSCKELQRQQAVNCSSLDSEEKLVSLFKRSYKINQTILTFAHKEIYRPGQILKFGFDSTHKSVFSPCSILHCV